MDSTSFANDFKRCHVFGLLPQQCCLIMTFNEKYHFLGNKPHDRAGADQPFVNSTRVNILCEYFIFTQLGGIFLTHLMEQKIFLTELIEI